MTSDLFTAGPQNYAAYGLIFRSEVPLPIALRTDLEGPVDVHIRLGTVEEEKIDWFDEGVLWKTAPGAFFIGIDETARYLVRSGSEILIEPVEGVGEYDLAVYLFGSVFGALLHQRGLWPLHASAINTPQGAVLFAGRSGMGKSTVAGALHERGFSILADDISAITSIKGGEVSVLPSIPQMKLAPDVVSALGVDLSDLRRDHVKGKYITPVEQFTMVPARVRQIVFLDIAEGSEISVKDVSGSEAVRLLTQATFRKKFMKGLGTHPLHFQRVNALVGAIPMMQIFRPIDLDGLPDLLAEIESILR